MLSALFDSQLARGISEFSIVKEFKRKERVYLLGVTEVCYTIAPEFGYRHLAKLLLQRHRANVRV